MHLITEYGGWRNRKMLGFYENLCRTLFTRYKGLVKYWLTFNEINMILHAPFMGAGLCFEEGENEEQVKYQAAHHELVASAMATKLTHEIDPDNKVGCMLAAGQYYPNTAHPRDYWAAMQEDVVAISLLMFRLVGSIQIMLRNSGNVMALSLR